MPQEELLKPRYKLIADYPGNILPIGLVLELYKWNRKEPEFKFSDDNEECYYLSESTLKRCDKIFKKLEWWEERKIEEMPEYIKGGNENGHGVFKVSRFVLDYDLPRVLCDNGKRMFGINQITPATKEEYESQSKK